MSSEFRPMLILFFAGQMLVSLNIASPRRKHSLYWKPPICLMYNKKSFNTFARERCLFIKNPESPTEISIHHLTDETKLSVGSEAEYYTLA